MNELTIFEKIIAGDIPAKILYQNEKIIVIADINPSRLGHTLIIPKVRKQNILEEDSSTISELFSFSKKLKNILEEVLGAKGFKIISNINSEAGQVIFHTHLHVIPYYEEDLHKNEHMDDKQLNLIVDKIKKELN